MFLTIDLVLPLHSYNINSTKLYKTEFLNKRRKQLRHVVPGKQLLSRLQLNLAHIADLSPVENCRVLAEVL
jgi:hypothetical protein